MNEGRGSDIGVSEETSCSKIVRAVSTYGVALFVKAIGLFLVVASLPNRRNGVIVFRGNLLYSEFIYHLILHIV